MGLTQAGWTAEALSLEMGREEEVVQQPTPFLPDPQLARPRMGLGRSCQQGRGLAAPPLSLPGHNG